MNKTVKTKKRVTKTKVTKKDESTLNKDLEGLMSVLSGEIELRQKNEEVERLKEAAKKRQKNLRRQDIVKGDTQLIDEENPVEKKIVQKIKLYDWEAPARFKYPFNSKTFFIILALALLFIIYLAVLGNYGLMAATIALLFFVYVTGTITPFNVSHEINTRGIDTIGKLYEWYMLENFWFCKKEDQYLLVVDTKLRAPRRLLLLVTEEEMKVIFVLLQDKLLYKDIRKQSWIEKQTYGVYIPLENI